MLQFRNLVIYGILMSCSWKAAVAQFPPIDSIRALIQASAGEEQKLRHIGSLADYLNSMPADTLLRYFSLAGRIAEKRNDGHMRRLSAYILTACELKKGHTEKVISLIDTSGIFRFKQQEDPLLYFKIQLLKANALNRLNQRVKALDLQFALMREAEQEADILKQAFALNYTGATYINTGRPDEARTYWLRALQLIQDNPSNQLHEIEAVLHSNMILIYYNHLDSGRNRVMADSFLYYTNQSIDLSRRNRVYWILASALAYRGEYYGMIHQPTQGERDLNEAISIRKKIGDPLYTVNDLLRLSSFFLYQKQYDSAILVLKRAMLESKQGHLVEPNIQILGLLSAAYKAKGDYASYSAALEQFILDADTANRRNAADKIAEITTRYDVQKKEATIVRQQLELAKRFNYIIASLFLLAIAFPILFMYIRRYKRRQKRRHEAAIQDAEEKERKRIASELHDNIGVQANALLHNSTLLRGEHADRDKLAGNLQETAREMLGNLRETVWALKHTDVSCGETWLRVIQFIAQMKRNYSDIQFDISGETPGDRVITSVRALHLVMVLKEAVNNAVRHSGTSHILIKTEYRSEWTIRVSDHGKGFDEQAKHDQPDSNGLAHMKERAEAGHFRLSVQSSSGQGTTVQLDIPV